MKLRLNVRFLSGCVRLASLISILVAPFLPWSAEGHVPHDNAAAVVASPQFEAFPHVYAIVRNTLFRSTNAGLTWNRLSNGLCSGETVAVAISPDYGADGEVVASCGDGGVYRSRDYGLSFSRLDERFGHLVIDFNYLKDSPFGLSLLTHEGALFVLENDSVFASVRIPEPATSITWERDGLMIGTEGGRVFTSEYPFRGDWDELVVLGSRITAMFWNSTSNDLLVGTRAHGVVSVHL
ncbi:MAG: hypothetical protein KJO98_04495, partial [Rhodothermia bacterium]|nr:hypothetical protein [Rhodothermia bacterium]